MKLDPMRNADSTLPRTEEGDFVLTLGNKELISVFVVGIILLGVFFAMGYALGRTNGTTTAGTVAKPEYVRTDAPSAMSGPPARTLEPPTTDLAPVPATIEAAPAPVAPAVDAPAFVVPTVGQTFLQVAAVAKPDAEMMLQVLRGRGFATSLAAGPPEKPDVLRVLVGPSVDTADTSQLKAKLEKAGFKSFVKKY